MKKDLNKKENFISKSDEPEGTNNLSSRASFMQEKIYHQNSFNGIDSFISIQPLNFSYDTPLYGRINNEAQSIRPDQQSIVQLNQFKTPTYSLNFVKDAFDDFYDFWQLSKRRQFINEQSELYDFKEVSSYVDPVQLYLAFMDNQYTGFLEFVKTNKFSKQIVDFRSFLKVFVAFFDLKMPLMPATFSSFCISKFSDPKISGMIIDLSGEDKTNDSNKFNKYIKDPNYIFFYNAVNTFGFNVDKKIPWRLIANIDSIAMKQYMNKYNLDSTSVYKTLFINNNLIDLSLFKSLMIKYYKNYTENNLLIIEPKIEKCKKENFTIKKQTTLRDQDTSKETTKFWLRSYLFLRARENNLNWDQPKFNAFVEKTTQIAEMLDIDQAMRYADQTLNIKNDNYKKNNGFVL